MLTASFIKTMIFLRWMSSLAYITLAAMLTLTYDVLAKYLAVAYLRILLNTFLSKLNYQNFFFYGYRSYIVDELQK